MIVLFEDNHLLALDKPAGLLTQPSPTESDSLESRAKKWLKETYSKPGDVFLQPVHRIDRPVCGVVLFAKTSKACSRLNTSIRERLVTETYRALVEGKLSPPKGTLEHYLTHDHHFSRVSQSKDPEAKKALLHYQTLEAKNGYSLLEIELVTGRYHQIRAQLSAVGCPIIGDKKYGSHLLTNDYSIKLQHYSLTFPHPTKEEVITVESRLSLLPF